MGPRRVVAAAVAALVALATVAEGRVTVLRQSDFDKGTYRIRKSGRYALGEDIVFAPNPENDFWPEHGDPEYPMAQYFLGFFAAITVEANNVDIDLRGHTLSQSDEFYLKQRFFNAIELNDRAFVVNEGVSSLNYQEGDELPEQIVPGLVTVQGVTIRNGVIDQVSHIGVHGNLARRVTIKNLDVRGFEVAGIQCNGCQRVKIVKCEVGPSATAVPSLATFASARFIDLYVNELLPYGFAKEEEAGFAGALATLESEIHFAGREQATTTGAVFARLRRSLELYADHVLDRVADDLSSEDAALLEEAVAVYGNPTGLPDGSVLYGILINKMGVPDVDDNFYGASATARIEISDTKVSGLKIHTIEVPAFQSSSGAFAQGPARDLVRVIDAAAPLTMRSLVGATYAGNVLSDVYFAFWQVSNDFFKVRVFDSDCANFATNQTMQYRLDGFENSPDASEVCLAVGTGQDPSLKPRDATMIIKRYFGGLGMTQGLFDWATGTVNSLADLLATSPLADVRRQSSHAIVCDHDTMFHNNFGVIGIKLQEARDVLLSKIDITDLENTAPRSHWVCGQKWQRADTGEVITTTTNRIDPGQGSAVRGFQLVRSEDIDMLDVQIDGLTSAHGQVFGIDVAGDTSDDRTDFADEKGVRFVKVRVDNLLASSGGLVRAISAAGSALVPKGLRVGAPAGLCLGVGSPQIAIQLQMPGEANMVPATQVPDFAPANLRALVMDHLESTFGLTFAAEDRDAALLDELDVLDNTGAPTGATMVPKRLDSQLNVLSICNGEDCSVGDSDAPNLVETFAFTVAGPAGGIMLHGLYGGASGKLLPEGSSISSGVMQLRNLVVPGTAQSARSISVTFFSKTPVSNLEVDDSTERTYWYYDLESPVFGSGLAAGTLGGGVQLSFGGSPDLDALTAAGTSPAYDGAPVPFPAHQLGVVADGTFGQRLSGQDAFPLLNAYHFTNEGAVRYFREFTSFKTDAQILALRKEFLVYLRDNFGVAQVSNVDAFDSVAVDGVVDLGGGTAVVAYEVNHAANQRIQTVVSGDSAEMAPPGARLREVGFRLFVGRPGLPTSAGHLNFASMLVFGVYVVENVPGVPAHEIRFQSRGPVTTNAWSASVIVNDVSSPHLGDGTLELLVTPPALTSAGLKIRVQGGFVFP
ncbi:Uncharacterized protein SCF082_LOCUS11692 [Durusdinium trenchii]|uniref:Uncharacterized protein n=1 Tax=Durusdinium trenchii TaxID=1381693 RepID=A0ABP0JF64_9DINO